MRSWADPSGDGVARVVQRSRRMPTWAVWFSCGRSLVTDASFAHKQTSSPFRLLTPFTPH
jgi:hypothetical protein